MTEDDNHQEYLKQIAKDFRSIYFVLSMFG